MKKYLIPLIFIFSSITCSISYYIIGSEIASDGTLIEPFFLIPIGYLCLFIGFISTILIFSFGKKNK